MSAQSGSAGSESEDSMGSLEANFNHMGREAKMPVSPTPTNPTSTTWVELRPLNPAFYPEP